MILKSCAHMERKRKQRELYNTLRPEPCQTNALILTRLSSGILGQEVKSEFSGHTSRWRRLARKLLPSFLDSW